MLPSRIKHWVWPVTPTQPLPQLGPASPLSLYAVQVVPFAAPTRILWRGVSAHSAPVSNTPVAPQSPGQDQAHKQLPGPCGGTAPAESSSCPEVTPAHMLPPAPTWAPSQGCSSQAQNSTHAASSVPETPPSSPSLTNIHCCISARFRLDDGPHGPPPCSQSLHVKCICCVVYSLGGPSKALMSPVCSSWPLSGHLTTLLPVPGAGEAVSSPPYLGPAWCRSEPGTQWAPPMKESLNLCGFFYVSCRFPVNSWWFRTYRLCVLEVSGDGEMGNCFGVTSPGAVTGAWHQQRWWQKTLEEQPRRLVDLCLTAVLHSC